MSAKVNGFGGSMFATTASSEAVETLPVKDRFALIKANSTEELVRILNAHAENTWFSIVRMGDNFAVLDLAVHPVTAVDPDSIETDEEDSVLQGNTNSFNTNLIA